MAALQGGGGQPRPLAIEKPRPLATGATKPFWDGLGRDEVIVPRCDDCGSWVWYPRRRCPGCLSDRLTWTVLSGRGTVHTFTVARQATHPAFAEELPQLLAVVELEEGIRLTTTLVDIDPDAVEVGMAVEPAFDHGADGVTLLRFRPAAPARPATPASR